MEAKELIGKGKVLTLDAARELIGKRITWTHMEYEYNEPEVHDTVIGSIISELKYYEGQPMYGYKSRAEYWRSFMTERDLQERERTLIILDENGRNTYMRCFLDSDIYDVPTFYCSDEDREVYYIEA